MTREAKLADDYYADQERRLSRESEARGPEPEIGLPASRGISESLDADQVEGLIFAMLGNVTDIADYLRVRSDRVRAFIDAKPALKRAMLEVYQGEVDRAVGILSTALRDPASFQNRFYGAKEWLKSDLGRKRGFGREAGLAAQIEVKTGGGDRTIVLKWIEPDGLPPPKIIDGEIK